MRSGTSSNQIVTVLQQAVPVLARTFGGCLFVVDARGQVLAAAGDDGETEAPSADLLRLCLRAAATGRPIWISSDAFPPSAHWAVPLGEVVLAGSNRERAMQDRAQLMALRDALPLIARVAGGEAVIFDREGTRLYSAFPDGTVREGVNTKTERFREAMVMQRPVISPAASAPGAMGVRIPITRDFGFGFNNAASVMRNQILLDEVKKHQGARFTFGDIVGQSPRMQAALRLAGRAALTTSPVLLIGETGTGKEMFAQAIHTGGPRRYRPFIAINCAALPAGLIESQLFGYTEGAFTGASKGGRPGLFEEADGGTLLLDEISEMPLELQAKLLRVLQEREVQRIGAVTGRAVDVRIIATTNRSLAEAVSQGQFREDLYYRLNVMDIHVPPLRERREDIPALARQLMLLCSVRVGKTISRIAPDAMELLQAYAWPGNVRELQNCIERALTLTDGDTILAANLPPAVQQAGGRRPVASLDQVVRQAERAAIEAALQASGGCRTQAAQQLGVSVSTLYRKLRELGIEAAPGA